MDEAPPLIQLQHATVYICGQTITMMGYGPIATSDTKQPGDIQALLQHPYARMWQLQIMGQLSILKRELVVGLGFVVSNGLFGDSTGRPLGSMKEPQGVIRFKVHASLTEHRKIREL